MVFSVLSNTRILDTKTLTGRHTAKFLVGVTPFSTIVFVSAAYPGNTSDKQLVIACNILDHLVAGDGIMADKGFLIDDILPDGNNIEDDMSRIYFNLSVNCFNTI